jgi:hypothetical protein
MERGNHSIFKPLNDNRSIFKDFARFLHNILLFPSIRMYSGDVLSRVTIPARSCLAWQAGWRSGFVISMT